MVLLLSNPGVPLAKYCGLPRREVAVYRHRHPGNSRRKYALQACLSQKMVDDYNKELIKHTDGKDPPKYYPERGLYYHKVWPTNNGTTPDILCGSQPRSREDIDKIVKLIRKGGSIISLQQDKDLQHWKVDLHKLQKQAALDGLNYIRRPARDFDPHSLRKSLPGIVKALHGVTIWQKRLHPLHSWSRPFASCLYCLPLLVSRLPIRQCIQARHRYPTVWAQVGCNTRSHLRPARRPWLGCLRASASHQLLCTQSGR